MGRLLRLLISTLVLSCIAGVSVDAQIKSIEEQVRIEILKRGIDESALRLALSNKGIDIDNLEALTAEQREEVRIIIGELEKQNDLRSQSVPSIFNTEVDSIPSDEVMEDSLIVVQDSIVLDTSQVAIYGHELFRNGQIKLITDVDGFIPTEDYSIGIGDELSVGIFGASRLDESFLVNDQGAIVIYPTQNSPGNVKVFVGGLTLRTAREKLISNFKKYYRFTPSQFILSVSAVRKVRVTLAGEVLRPGEYVVSGLNGISNLIGGAGGFTDIGGVRLIQLVKRNGQSSTFDLYKMLNQPGSQATLSLDNGDYIIVPVAQHLVSITGAVRREHTFELLEGEGVIELIQYAGGLDKGASLTSFDVSRYEEEKRVFKEIPYAELIKKRGNYNLKNGDEILVKRINEELENYVSILGEVRSPGNYEFLEELTIRDLIQLGGLKPTSKRDKAYIRRTNADGSINTFPVSIENVLRGIGEDVNIQLQDRDELTIWSMERFTDNKTIKVAGAVREESSFDYDEGGTLRVSDAITLAGGLRTDAANYAHIHRLDPLNPQELKYIKVDLDRVVNDPVAVDNIFLEPFDSLYIYKRNEYLEDVNIRISGAVNNPGSFSYGDRMSLVDAITLAGGFRLSSATNQIEVSRVIIKDNQPTKTIVERVSLSREDLRNFQNGNNEYLLEPYDNVFVRYVPQFELQQNVTIQGEVALPGEYSLIKDNETVYDLISRANGLTVEAFPAAATLIRSEDDLGTLVMRLDEVMLDPSSKFNYKLKNGDKIYIPKVKDYVKIEGYAQYLIQNDQKQVVTPFHTNKNALFYIDQYAGGFADNARTDKIFVTYPNGEVKTTIKRFPFGKKHPDVVPGSTISIGPKRVDISASKNGDDVNWTKTLGDSVAQAMSILTLILLVQRLD